jgi:hypothetical protein
MKDTMPAAPSLGELADKYGSDKGPKKHRYTELYELLFRPFRERPVTFLEMGLLIGGPEHGIDAGRETRDLPSIRMWLDYFREAQIIGLDISDFSWFLHPRFKFIQCDMDDRSEIARAAGEIGSADIVIDDASHASHHQQNAFLEIFPGLPSGGLYVIEDLRWQPETFERPGITKTAQLFRGFSETREFHHDDPATEAEFRSLASEISGCFVFQVKYTKTRRDQVAVIHKR